MAYSQNAAGQKHGWRSGLEERVGESLAARGVPFFFEMDVIEYEVPAQVRRYTPDFTFTSRSGKKILVETKGRWVRADRLKMKLIVQQFPDLDIRMVFQRPNEKIAKGSKTTYAAWCEKHLGIPWAKGDIPDAWLEE